MLQDRHASASPTIAVDTEADKPYADKPCNAGQDDNRAHLTVDPFRITIGWFERVAGRGVRSLHRIRGIDHGCLPALSKAYRQSAQDQDDELCEVEHTVEAAL